MTTKNPFKPAFPKSRLVGTKLAAIVRNLDSDEAQEALVATLVFYGIFVPVSLR